MGERQKKKTNLQDYITKSLLIKRLWNIDKKWKEKDKRQSFWVQEWKQKGQRTRSSRKEHKIPSKKGNIVKVFLKLWWGDGVQWAYLLPSYSTYYMFVLDVHYAFLFHLFVILMHSVNLFSFSPMISCDMI